MFDQVWDVVDGGGCDFEIDEYVGWCDDQDFWNQCEFVVYELVDGDVEQGCVEIDVVCDD